MTVKTYELRCNGVAWCVGTIKDCAEHAWLEMRRKHAAVPEASLTAMEKDLKKMRSATVVNGYALEIVPIEEEYEEEEED